MADDYDEEKSISAIGTEIEYYGKMMINSLNVDCSNLTRNLDDILEIFSSYLTILDKV